MRGGISMCALESGEGRPKFSGVSIGFSLSETRDGWMGICGYYRFILWVIHTLENCSITGHTYWIYSRHTYIYLFQTYLYISIPDWHLYWIYSGWHSFWIYSGWHSFWIYSRHTCLSNRGNHY
uniref:Uncharacterized protein n=1 Tax=Picea glauca TaxID=3330 RepID=A0A101M1C6_PICGL|nr:hypothetical protein ABT39_MTgene3657 [Picea glauca]